ncbi:MAG: hypothetical protein A2571_02500 [Candidatus Vogelbacteria bacterium RIFOXYD1_FULL_44_32]|uniref:DUF8128 domain-containing protein n=1 Tax=Candidatus Vogelbacteria bacterium RIFOXYD1_FULL_44_32 TaxID=1802438 RepID=A0A1G2QDF4_9BACT|nr:MAG: hypothetical protein A2571_02500 [Candidatus Vogelbacteria bacterium RIFOXYD1_FULL_44_32]
MDLSAAYFSAVKELLFDAFGGTPLLLWYVLPIALVVLVWENWLEYSQAKFIKKMDWKLLEIKIPREVTKPPQAMEVLMQIFQQGNDGTFVERWFKGQVRFWFSLEMASFGGDVHFYIRTPKKFRNAVEAQLYSQYSSAEITEVEDYTLNMPFGTEGSDWQLWGTNLKLSKPDFYPIKTYIDYGLDKEMEEENKVDPLTPVLELLGSIGPGEQIWLQIPVMDAKKRFNKKDSWYKKADWRDAAKGEIEKLQRRDVKTKEGEFNLAKFSQTPQEKIAAEAITRSLNKPGFDCGYRVLYFAKKDVFNPGIIMGIIGSIKQYNSPNLNGFKLGKRVGFDYPWQDITGWRTKRIRWEFFDAYRQRSYFYKPYKFLPFILTSEELATIYRFPGQVASTPTLGRIESKRAEPPGNLPI